jgi:hypothetical protein
VYILREGGEKRLITQEEATATYEQLLATESGMAMRAGADHSWKKWLALVAAGITG